MIPSEEAQPRVGKQIKLHKPISHKFVDIKCEIEVVEVVESKSKFKVNSCFYVWSEPD